MTATKIDDMLDAFDVIEAAKARMRKLMRDGMTLTFLYPAGRDVRLTPRHLLEEAIHQSDCSAVVRMLSIGDHAEAGRLLADALKKAIAETCEDEVSEWLAHQSLNQEDAA
jgi:hypothetical protein